ncbi:PepSY domain-containing protein [Duganella sp. sic0402]|uniref:PepSY domain-containing protein n=1 Tax=Duganella sp. sic0402 TaxID=2854786 RepID=UPI001C456CC9|nr:PepSY domain-containing protein [Duganella sp. sic0402]MBV7536841.1 PepSY domain-containing protein [Duganella sp. sic0402]
MSKRLLFLLHRWMGIILCMFFAMWFLSGMVMMYVGYPKLTETERLQHLPTLTADASLLAPQQAMERAHISGPFADLRLSMASAGRPVYLVQPTASKATIVVDARTGQRVMVTDAQRAVASAAAYAGPGTAPRYLDMTDEDAFTHTRSLDRHRPLHRVQLDDTAQTLLYISGRTGEVVRDASRNERLWNYAGAWIHWLYPFRGGVLDRYWADIVNWLAIAGTVMVLIGATVGIQRWRFSRPYRSGSRSPYPDKFMRWHHIGGLLFAVIATTWIFSGLMSMNPWRVFTSSAAQLRMSSLEQGALQPSALDAAPAALLAAANGDIRELRWTRVLGRTVVLAQPASGKPTLIDSHSATATVIDANALTEAARGLLPAPLISVETLSAYDFYYYSRDEHSMTSGSVKPLPVLRLVFADAQHSWIYLDPHTGMVVTRCDRLQRWSRWLFSLLHSWDWLPLVERRPLWDGVLILLSLGGVVMSLTGVVIGWRRLGKKLRA